MVTALALCDSVKRPVLAQLAYETSWLANTYGPSRVSVQQSVDSMYVAPDGTIYTNAGWDESGREAGIYRDGQSLPPAGFTHGWGYSGGKAIAGNDEYLFLAQRADSQGGQLLGSQTWPAKGLCWFGISRRRLSRPSSPAPFAGGKGGAGGTLSQSFLVINEVAENVDAAVAGLAAGPSRLYASVPYTNEIRVYDTATMASRQSIPFLSPGRLALDPQGRLWVIQQKTSDFPARIVHLTPAGEPLDGAIEGLDDPRDLAFDNRGRLLVAEAGPRQQVLIYDVSSTPALAGTLGAPGGIASGVSGEVGNAKLILPAAVGSDADGNLYVASGAFGADIRKFSPAGELVWRLLGLEFVDCTAFDETTDGVDVYSKFHHFGMDYSKRNGQEWTWKATTVDRYAYPHDPRIDPSFPAVNTTSAVAVRYFEGHKFLFLVGDVLLIYRFDGEIAVPSAMIAPGITSWQNPDYPRKVRFMWRDTNGDGDFQADEFFGDDGAAETAWGWDVDYDGTVWQAREDRGLVRFPLGGLDEAGNPIYSRGTAVTIRAPQPFTTVERVRYDSRTDTMYLSGYTRDHPIAGNGYWGQAGTELARYDNWSEGNRTPRYRIVLPYSPPYGSVKAFTVAGQRIFAGILASSGSAQNANPQNLYVYDASTGAQTGQLTPGPEVGSATGWIDLNHGVQAFQRTNGEYEVFVEDVVWGKNILYRLR